MKKLCLITITGMLSACGVHERLQDLDKQASHAASHISQQQYAFYQRVDQRFNESDAFVEQPWVVGRAEPLARDLTLPLPLRRHINTTLVFGDQRLDLHDIAEKISVATQLPVRVQPEALLSPSHFTRSASRQTMPIGSAEPLTIQLNGVDEPLASILDRICAQLGIYWRQYQNGIEFYKVESRVFELKGLSLRSGAQASLGAGNSSQEGFSSQSGTHMQSHEHELMDVVRSRVETLLTGMGQVSALPGASSALLVVDTPDVLEQVAAYIQRENRNLSRRVRLLFEELTVELQDDSQTALSWGALFTNSRWSASLLAPKAALTSAYSAGLTLGQGNFESSEAVVSAISTLGTVVRRNTVPVMSLNRRPVTHALRTTFSYIDKVESVPTTGYGGSINYSSSVSQREQTVGSLLTLIPEALDDGQIMLSLAYDNTTAQPLTMTEVGKGAQAMAVQQLTVEGAGMVQHVILDPGKPLLISGFDRSEHIGHERRLNPGAPLMLGGADQHKSKSLRTVILLTAQVEEGAD